MLEWRAKTSRTTLPQDCPSLGLSVRPYLLAIAASAVLFPTALVAQDEHVILADGPPLWGDNPRVVEELRIGSLAGDENYMFGLAAGVAVTADGDIWVSDRILGTVRRYTRHGVHIGDVGRKGAGPGEFNYLMDLRILADGSVAVWDPMNNRVHIFDEQGDFLSDFRVPVAGMVGGRDLQTIETDTAGNIYAIGFIPPYPDPGAARRFWIRYDTDRDSADTLWIPRPEREGTYHAIRSGTAMSPLGYLVQARNDEYLFRFTGGGKELVIRRTSEPVRYHRAERREAQLFEDHYAARNGQAPRRIPSTKPVWKSFEVDTEGRLWVERYALGEPVEETEADRESRLEYDNPPRTWGEPVVYDVIRSDGRFLGTVRFPTGPGIRPSSRINVALARGHYVWTIERGPYDEHYVVRYRIEPSS